MKQTKEQTKRYNQTRYKKQTAMGWKSYAFRVPPEIGEKVMEYKRTIFAEWKANQLKQSTK